MNSWYWPADTLPTKLFARVMSSRPMQRRILEKNFFVEKLIPAGTTRDLSNQEMEHYRGVQPTLEARAGVAQFPRQILGSGPWLAELAKAAPASLASKPVTLVWGRRDRAFGSRKNLARWTTDFPGAQLTELPDANHFVQEDAPEEIANAVTRRFG